MNDAPGGLVLPNGRPHVPQHAGPCPNCGANAKDKRRVLGGGAPRCIQCGYQENNGETDG